MKNLTFLFLLAFTISFGQTDSHGNPIFNNELINEEKYEKFELTSSYYTIDNNISNKGSSVYVSDNPTPTEYLKFSRDLPSYFFIIHNGPNVIAMIILMQKNEGEKTTLTYNIVNPNTGKSIQAPCSVWGDISEMRARELIRIKSDTSAAIIDLPNNGKGLLYQGMAYRIQPYEKLKAEILDIAKHLTNGPEKIKDPVEYIKKETIGGNLDFNKVLENEQQSLFMYEGIAYNKKDFAIFLWGKKVKTLGIESSKKATKLWEEIYEKSLTDPEKKALTNGFNSKAKE